MTSRWRPRRLATDRRPDLQGIAGAGPILGGGPARIPAEVPGLDWSTWPMAEELSSGAAAVPLHRRGGLGILRLLRGWPGDVVRVVARDESSPDGEFQPAQPQVDPAPAGLPHLIIDRRATSVALRQTLDEWRAAQRELEGLVVGSRERARTQANVELLRRRHHRLFIQLTRSER